MSFRTISIILIALTTGYSAQAARYTYHDLLVESTTRVNSLGNILATSATGAPTILKPTKDAQGNITGFNSYELSVSALTATAIRTVAEDINDPSDQSPNEMIPGWYEEADGSKHAVLWNSTPGGSYEVILLPKFEYRRTLCLTGAKAERNAANCFTAGEADSLIASTKNCANPTPFFDPAKPDDPITVIAVECELQSRAFGVNNDGLIIGESITSDNQTRAIFWSKTAVEDNTTGEVNYFAYDLGLKVNGPGDYTRRNGSTSFIAKSDNLVVGNLKINASDTLNEPSVWPEVSGSGDYKDPLLIIRDTKNTTNFPISGNERTVTATSLSGEQLSGWFQDEQNDPYAILWDFTLDARTELWSISNVSYGQQRLLNGEPSLTLNSEGKGKILDRNTRRETVGTSADGVSDDGVDINNAFYSTSECGVQNLNSLLSTDQSSNFVLESAHSISTTENKSYILATGKTIPAAIPQNYLLESTTVDVDLSISLNSNHVTLTSGQRHTYNMVVKNSAFQGNYATCVKVRLAALVPIREKTPQEYSFALNNQDPNDDDAYVYKEGGLTFLSAKASGNTTCTLGHIEVICTIARLDPGEEVAIEVATEPRGLLADRNVKTEATTYATEDESDRVNNKAVTLTAVTREGCFIATAAYGSYFEPQVKILRTFRDDVLTKTAAGRWFIEQYYHYSPAMAQWLTMNPQWKPLVRASLTPLIWTVKFPLESSLLLLGLLALLILQRQNRNEVAPA